MAKNLKWIAVLDKFDVLMGFEKVSKIKDSDIEVPENCDLDTNEKYRWDRNSKSFIPLGMLVGKPPRSRVSQETAIFLMMQAYVNGNPIPQECKEYVTWYRDNIKKHEDQVKRWRNKK